MIIQTFIAIKPFTNLKLQVFSQDIIYERSPILKIRKKTFSLKKFCWRKIIKKLHKNIGTQSKQPSTSNLLQKIKSFHMFNPWRFLCRTPFLRWNSKCLFLINRTAAPAKIAFLIDYSFLSRAWHRPLFSNCIPTPIFLALRRIFLLWL